MVVAEIQQAQRVACLHCGAVCGADGGALMTPAPTTHDRAREIVVARLYAPACDEYKYPQMVADAAADVQEDYLNAADNILAAIVEGTAAVQRGLL